MAVRAKCASNLSQASSLASLGPLAPPLHTSCAALCVWLSISPSVLPFPTPSSILLTLLWATASPLVPRGLSTHCPLCLESFPPPIHGSSLFIQSILKSTRHSKALWDQNFPVILSLPSQLLFFHPKHIAPPDLLSITYNLLPICLPIIYLLSICLYVYLSINVPIVYPLTFLEVRAGTFLYSPL